MKVRTRLGWREFVHCLEQVKTEGLVDGEIEFLTFEEHESRFRRSDGFVFHLGTRYRDSRHSQFINQTGKYGRGKAWAATYDEWGWFLAEVLRLDPRAVFVGDYTRYEGADDFRSKTANRFGPSAPGEQKEPVLTKGGFSYFNGVTYPETRMR